MSGSASIAHIEYRHKDRDDHDMDIKLGKMKKGVSEPHLDRTLEKTYSSPRKALNPSFKGNYDNHCVVVMNR